MVKLEKNIAKNIAWLQTMKQKNGYAGPVIHYWKDCLNYIGPGMDWRYEGLIQGYLELFKKTEEKEFLMLAIECGEFLVKSQCRNGVFFNSGFESNPTFNRGSTPHDSAACIGLLELAQELKKLSLDWQKYFNSAKKNLELFHLRELYIEQKGLFAQYRKQDALRVPNAFVPNKIATIIELLLKMHNFTNKKFYLRLAIKNADFITKMQDCEFDGGIYQSNDKNKIITIYNARCIVPLLMLYEITSSEKYLSCALDAIKFIKKMENKEGGFYFGYIKQDDNWKKIYYPIFIAGGAEVLRAITYAKHFDSSLKIKRKNINFILSNILESGGFKTSIGMNLKNTAKKRFKKEGWRDIVPVVGWNDKMFRFMAMMLKEGCVIENVDIGTTHIYCEEGEYYEDKEKIIILPTNSGQNQKIIFKKKAMFREPETFFKKAVYSISKIFHQAGIRNRWGARILKIAGVK